MSWGVRRRRRVDPGNPVAKMMCAYTGLIFPATEMQKQMEYRGNALVWTGHWVAKKYADRPQPSLQPYRPRPWEEAPTMPIRGEDLGTNGNYTARGYTAQVYTAPVYANG